ncbi:uncharacterized protein LOC110428039 [Herrania umbratica]|uniref:Uncharacterized protein LOC110428039 n=1 Tax=Herrania umbratica TaxID=108875 RepID=A0A6J1BIK0_9ROSI|nr:uncharacterized protein LOC110428039 [Herrania umbratica]
MEIMPSTCCENLKRGWRRRKYQRLHGATRSKRKLRIPRLGNIATRRVWELKTIPKPSLKMVSPIKILTKVHGAYVDMMMRLVNTMGKANNGGLFRGKKVAKDRHVSIVSGGDEVDSKLVLEIYKTLAASRELRGL